MPAWGNVDASHLGGDAGGWQAGRADRIRGHRRRAFLPSILEKSWSPSSPRRKKERGRGSGWQFAGELFKKDHGDIQIASEVGKGTAVRIVLPVKNASMSAASATAVRRNRAVGIGSERNCWMAEAKRGRLLIVDDEVELKNALCETLADEGYATVGAASGEEAAQGAR